MKLLPRLLYRVHLRRTWKSSSFSSKLQNLHVCSVTGSPEIVRSLSSAVVRIHVPNHCWSNMFINVIETYKTVGSHSPNPKHLDHWFIVHEFTIVINSVETPLPILLIHSVCPLDAAIRRHRDRYTSLNDLM